MIRAVAVSADGEQGPVYTKTFFTSEDPTKGDNGLMVISISTDPGYLLDYETGILIKGRPFDEWYEKKENKAIVRDPNRRYKLVANFTQKGKEWERPASVEFLCSDDDICIQQDAGICIHGKASRIFPNRSFRVSFSRNYGPCSLDCDLFDDGTSSYDSITIRNGGNTATSIPYKDSLQQSLLSGRSFLTQRSRPAVLYINWEYWGPYNLTERFTADTLEEMYGLVDVLVVKDAAYDDGNKLFMYLYDELQEFTDRDMSDPAVWKAFCDTVDVINMAEYFAAQIYMANCDLRYYSNCILWRSVYDDGTKYADGKWRFIMNDTEYSSGLYGSVDTAYNADTMSRMMDYFPLFRSALNSPDFRELFLRALKDIGSSDLSYDRVCSALDEYETEWSALFGDSRRRFGDYSELHDSYLKRMKDFYRKRYSYIVPRAESILKKI